MCSSGEIHAAVGGMVSGGVAVVGSNPTLFAANPFPSRFDY